MRENLEGEYVKENNRVEQKDYISVAGFGQSGKFGRRLVGLGDRVVGELRQDSISSMSLLQEEITCNLV